MIGGRYHTLDSYTGEIVHQSNQRPYSGISGRRRGAGGRHYTEKQVIIALVCFTILVVSLI